MNFQNDSHGRVAHAKGMSVCGPSCRGVCLHQVEVVAGCDDAASFRDFVCQFISLECPAPEPCVAAPCANFPVCGMRAPQWLLDANGGVCVHPCDMMYGRVFAFATFAADDPCPLCFEPGKVAVIYPCAHKVCAKCYAATVFNDAVVQVMKRCPMCRVEGVPIGAMRPGRADTDYGPPMVDCE